MLVFNPHFQALGMDTVATLLALRVALSLEDFIADRTAIVLADFRKIVFLDSFVLQWFHLLSQVLMNCLGFAFG